MNWFYKMKTIVIGFEKKYIELRIYFIFETEATDKFIQYFFHF